MRLGRPQPKQFLSIRGRSVLDRSVSLLATHPEIDEVIVVLPADLLEAWDHANRWTKPVRAVAGGARRQDSVSNGFGHASERAEIVVVHDAVRPFASPELVTRTIRAAIADGAAVAALQASDTVKLADRASENGGTEPRRVLETIARESIFLAQTPQAFRRDVLRDALGRGQATDEATLVERAGYRVRIVDGEATNIKITTPDDITIAEAIAAARDLEQSGGDRVTAAATDETPARPARTGRAGTGYDLHRLVPGRRLVLGGIEIPFERGADGHSDADVVCHAVTDAILGAACLGDIGAHFPDSDPQWKDASSLELLSRAVALVTRSGLEVGNVDVTIVLERPKVRDHVEAMRKNVARALAVDAGRVSIKAKTNEGVGAIGRGEAVAAHAVALLRRSSNR